jgi:uncharacterized protein YecE (DUF72 family)
VFYPKPRPADFDELAFYAQFFDFVEINTTFYGQPRADIAAQWARRTPPDFAFAVKLYQQFTHPAMFQRRIKDALSRTLGADDLPDQAIEALVQANQADIDAFRRGIEPLASAGKLGPLLAQFPASFRNDAAARAHLSALLRAFGDYTIAVELRHRSWNDTRIAEMLSAFGAAWVEIDEPQFKDSIRPPAPDARAPLTYRRLHGRQAKAWWRGNRDERYDYLYTEGELRPIATGVEQEVKPRRYIAFNNHPNAKAVVNALTLKRLLGQPLERALPRALVAAYPDVGDIEVAERLPAAD